MSYDMFAGSIESSWEDYDQYMIQTGQWTTQDEYNYMMEAEYQQQMYAAYSYDYENDGF